MIIHDAIRSLKKDFSKAFFYWVTFVLTTMFIFLFFNICSSDPNLNPLNNSQNVITYVTALVLILCSIDILFANDFYVKLKGKDLAVRLICGGTFGQMAAFLLIQTILLLVLAVPLGIGLAYASIPFVNAFLSMANSGEMMVVVHSDAFIQASAILVYVIFWIIILNLSFAYKNAVGLLMSPSTIICSSDEGMAKLVYTQMTDALGEKSKIAKFVHWLMHATFVKAFFFAVLLIGSMGIVYYNRHLASVASIVGLFGINGVVNNILLPTLNKNITNKKVNNPIVVAYQGFVRRDFKVLRNNIFLFLASAIVLSAMFITKMDYSLSMMAILLSYIVMSTLQVLCLMFRFGTEVSIRARLFKTLKHIGYLDADLKKIIRNEVFFIYGFLMIVSVLYVGNMLFSFFVCGDVGMNIIALLLGCLLVPLVLCCAINLAMYKHAVLESKK